MSYARAASMRQCGPATTGCQRRVPARRAGSHRRQYPAARANSTALENRRHHSGDRRAGTQSADRPARNERESSCGEPEDPGMTRTFGVGGLPAATGLAISHRGFFRLPNVMLCSRPARWSKPVRRSPRPHQPSQEPTRISVRASRDASADRRSGTNGLRD